MFVFLFCSVVYNHCTYYKKLKGDSQIYLEFQGQIVWIALIRSYFIQLPMTKLYQQQDIKKINLSTEISKLT